MEEGCREKRGWRESTKEEGVGGDVCGHWTGRVLFESQGLWWVRERQPPATRRSVQVASSRHGSDTFSLSSARSMQDDAMQHVYSLTFNLCPQEKFLFSLLRWRNDFLRGCCPIRPPAGRCGCALRCHF
jgi:hypothetical protein